jgi:hypothetical protein
MGKRNRIGLTEQEILNFGLDEEEINPPTSLRGQLNYVDGTGWIRVPVNGTFPLSKLDFTSGDLDYKGVNNSISAADADTDWIITKYTWVSGNPTVIKQRVTSWTDRAIGW